MLEKRSLGTLKRTNSEDSLNDRFKETVHKNKSRNVRFVL